MDPLELLSQRWKLQNLDPFEERWKVTDGDEVGYLKTQVGAIRSRPSILESDRHWTSDDGKTSLLYVNVTMADRITDMYEGYLLTRPMSPILSARARRETPSLGKGVSSRKLPWSNERLLRICSIRKAQEVVSEETSVDVDDVL